MPKGDGLAERNRERADRKRAAQLGRYRVDETTGCWLWEGGTDRDGYGKVKRNRKTVRAHHVFHEAHKGPIPAGQVVCHTCDRPPCVNPEHLFTGTILDNERDKDRKGRRPPTPFVPGHRIGGRGDQHNRAKLTFAAVAAIRASGRPTRELAAEYGVSMSAIQRARSGVFWRLPADDPA